MPNYTPQFQAFCQREFLRFIPFANPNDRNSPNDYSEANAKKLINRLDSCTPLQLQCISEFAQAAKAAFEASAQHNIVEYQQFFIALEKKLKKCQKNASKSAGQSANSGHSSYKPTAPAGQSIYESMMHTLAYDATTVGASAMFFLAFSGLRFLVGSPYWEQVAEYAANPERQFKPENLTPDQEAKNLHRDSTRDEILQAGYLPPPDLASAFDIEFKTFMNKVGHMSKQNNESSELNQLGAKAAGRR